jgi:diguanylate cyclase (GGDEF)-like protein/PAS domain S-box-containing protein
MAYNKTAKYIFIISFAIAILYPLINSRIIFPSFTELLIQNTEDEAIRLANNLSSFVVSDNAVRKRPAEFTDVFEKAKEDYNLEKIKLFSEYGEIIYSTNPGDVGKVNQKDYFYEIVAKGKTYTKLVQKDTRTLEERIVSSDVIETCVPIVVKDKFLGAFEIYYDITQKKNLISNTAFRSSLISFSLMFCFFVLITIILLKSDTDTQRFQADRLSSIYQSPFFMLCFMLIAIFAVECIVMFMLSSFPTMSNMGRAILDSSLLVMLSSPFIYFFLLRPLLQQIQVRKRAEEELKESKSELEQRVKDRTAELAEINRVLIEDIKKREQAEEALFQAKNNWEDTFNTITDMITIHDRDYNIIHANKAAEKILGLPLLETTKLKCYTYYHGTDKPPAECVSCNCLRTGMPLMSEIFEPNLGKYIEIRAIPRLDNNNEITGLIHVVRDITKRKKSEMELQKSEERYRALVDSTEDSIYLVDENYRYLFMNKQHLSRLGLTEGQYLSEPFSKFHSPDETNIFNGNIDRIFKTGKSDQYGYRSLRDGRYFLQTFSPVKDSYGKTIAVTIISKDISERKEMEERLRVLLITDELTGLYNRRGFFTLADKQIKLASRLEKGLILIYADLDNFKMINDRFGHDEGDNALREVSTILREVFRDSDIIARIGGDEFAIMAIESPETNINILASRLRENLDAYNAASEKTYDLTLSMGIIQCDSEYNLSADTLLSRADKLMYEQKKEKQRA